MIYNLIERNQGRLVDSTGDNLLAEFSSVVDAVRCAVQIQEDLKAKNDGLDESRKMEFRIGINLGDVIQEGNRIYGDGVNVAARIESLADAGGVCISRSVYNQVKRKLNLKYEDIGEHHVKNIDEPVRVYKVLMEPRVIEAEEKQEFKTVLSDTPPPLTDKPSIAVLPFDNMSTNPDQEYLADGITDQIIAGLSMMPYLFVIARNSSFIYKGQPVKVQQVAHELSVQYVLEGSVQQSGNRIRVTAQLIDALTGRHVWSERYDRLLEDLFAVQDEIMLNIMRAMDVSVVGLGTLQDHPIPQSVEAYLKILKAFELLFHFNKDDNLSARKLLQEAIDLDPEYGPAYGFMGWTYWHEVTRGWSDDPDASLRKAEELGEKAITLGGVVGHNLLMGVYSFRGQNDKAIAEGEKGLAISPNFANLNVRFGETLSNVGRHDEAIERVKKAICLNPHHQPHYLSILGACYLRAGMDGNAIEYLERHVQLDPNTSFAWLSLASLYAQLGHDEEAKKAAKEVHRIAPDYSWEKYGRGFRFPDKEVERRFFDGLRKVGLM
jgi:adenylate cyclase